MNQRVAGQLSLEEMPLRPHLSAWKGVRWGASRPRGNYIPQGSFGPSVGGEEEDKGLLR